MTTIDTLQLEISTEPNCNGVHVVRWVEQASWGALTHMITTAAPDELERTRADFALFCTVPQEQRFDAARAVRFSSRPVSEVLASYLPAAAGQQTALF